MPTIMQVSWGGGISETSVAVLDRKQAKLCPPLVQRVLFPTNKEQGGRGLSITITISFMSTDTLSHTKFSGMQTLWSCITPQ